MERDKSNEMTILSDNTTTQVRYINDRFDRGKISELERSKYLKEIEEIHRNKLIEILNKYKQ